MHTSSFPDYQPTCYPLWPSTANALVCSGQCEAINAQYVHSAHSRRVHSPLQGVTNRVGKIRSTQRTAFIALAYECNDDVVTSKVVNGIAPRGLGVEVP